MAVISDESGVTLGDGLAVAMFDETGGAGVAAVIQPVEVAQLRCPRCWFTGPFTPYAALTARCSRCEWPMTLAAATAPNPAVPASGTPYTNASGSVLSVALSGGTASAVSISGVSQGLAAPAAPAVAAAGTDGSMTAGVYQAVTTYVNANGETMASAAGSATISSTKHLTVPSPPAVSGATGWNAYVTIHDGSTFKLQNGTPTAIGTDLTLTADPTTSGATPPAANTTFGTMLVPAGGTITLTYAGGAPTWTVALPVTSGGVSAGGTSLPFAQGGTAFAAGQVLIVDPAGASDVVTVNGTPTATSVPVTALNSAHASGKSVTVAQVSPALSGAGLENVPATAY
jgi:hypothetical protein